MRQAIVPVEYTVTRDSRPIGVTHLSLTRFDDWIRAGWFFPSGMSPAVAAAFDWQCEFNFELRCPDGSIVPTEWIGIQDTERLIALGAEEDEEALDTDSCFDNDWIDEPEWTRPREPDWTTERPEWMPDVEAVDLPRYQILVRLAAPSAIP
jgi:hypothetical protein